MEERKWKFSSPRQPEPWNPVTVLSPWSLDGINLELTSSVMNQYGRQIKATILETLERLGVENASVTVVDKALWTAP